MKYINSLLLMSMVISLYTSSAICEDRLLSTIQVPNDEFYESSKVQRVGAVAIFPNGDKLVTGTKNLIVWDLKTGMQIVDDKSYRQQSWTYCLSVSPDERLILSGGRGLNAYLWDFNTEQKPRILKTSPNSSGVSSNYLGVTGVCFFDSNETAITANNTGVVQIWDVQSLKELQRHENLGDIRSIQLMPNQSVLIIQKASNFYLLDIETGKRSELVWSDSVSIAQEGRMLVSNQGNLVRVFNVDGLELKEVKQYEVDIYQTMKCVAVDSSGENIILGKVANYDHWENRLFDRELYGVTSERSSKLYEDTESKSFTLVGKNEIRLFNQNYNDEMIRFFPDGKRYLTVNGTKVNVWNFNG